MKKILLLILITSLSFAGVYYEAHKIGEVKTNWRLYNSYLDVVCIDSVQYVMDARGNNGWMSPLYDKNGTIKTCE